MLAPQVDQVTIAKRIYQSQLSQLTQNGGGFSPLGPQVAIFRRINQLWLLFGG